MYSYSYKMAENRHSSCTLLEKGWV